MAHSIIVITGTPVWANEVAQVLREKGFTPAHYTERKSYVARLADDNAAMVLVGDGEDWRFWTVTPKTSPATRRIPVVMVTDDAEIGEAALRGGANLVVAPDELLAELPTLLEDLARVPDPAVMATLDAQCDDPLPPEAVEAVKKFNSGEFYKQHDLFEALWMAEEHPIRDLYRAVLQVGIAYYQATLGNQRGSHKMLLRSLQWLALLPDVCQGIDIAALRADAARVRAELERVGEDGMEGFDRSLLKPVKMIEKED
jgi:predicted metal-dependent hydrolase